MDPRVKRVSELPGGFVVFYSEYCHRYYATHHQKGNAFRFLWKTGELAAGTSTNPSSDIDDDPGWFKSVEEVEEAARLYAARNAPPEKKMPPRTLKQLADECLQIQDACNVVGLSKGYARAIQDLVEELRRKGLPNDTEAVSKHPINRWWLDKLCSLSGIGTDWSSSPAFLEVTALSNQEDDK